MTDSRPGSCTAQLTDPSTYSAVSLSSVRAKKRSDRWLGPRPRRLRVSGTQKTRSVFRYGSSATAATGRRNRTLTNVPEKCARTRESPPWVGRRTPKGGIPGLQRGEELNPRLPEVRRRSQSRTGERYSRYRSSQRRRSRNNRS